MGLFSLWQPTDGSNRAAAVRTERGTKKLKQKNLSEIKLSYCKRPFTLNVYSYGLSHQEQIYSL